MLKVLNLNAAYFLMEEQLKGGLPPQVLWFGGIVGKTYARYTFMLIQTTAREWNGLMEK